MKARQLVEGASYGPEALKVMVAREDVRDVKAPKTAALEATALAYWKRSSPNPKVSL
jgi:hypothetical protein